MVSHQTPGSNARIRAVQDSGRIHVTNADNAYKPGTRMSRPANHRPLEDSMLAYTQRMHEIAQFKRDSALMGSASSIGSSGASVDRHLALRSKRPQHPRPHQRALSLGALIGQNSKNEPVQGIPEKTHRLHSVPNRLPSLNVPPQPAQDQDKTRFQINFVSASDLFELVNFSLRSKPSRDESMRQLKYEESMKLMRKSDFLGSVFSGNAPKVVEEQKQDGDIETLFVHGVPSPREIKKDDHKTRYHRKNDRLGSVDETSKTPQHGNISMQTPLRLSEPSSQHNVDLFREKHLILLQPPKLRHRPKRAKRMTLHRSQLSVIPEDERRRQEGSTAQVQKKASTRMPVVPTSSSLTAIKSTRKGERVDAPVKDTRPPNSGLNSTGDEHIEYKPPEMTFGHETNKEDSSSQPQSLSTEPLSSGKLPGLFENPKKRPHVTPSPSNHTHSIPFPRRKSKGDSPRQNGRTGFSTEDSRIPAGTLPDESLAPIDARRHGRAPTKFGNLVFLRDTSDYTYHRYS